jgi:hypothetical protein
MDRTELRETMMALLDTIEKKNEKIYTLELREIGTWRSDQDIKVGQVEERRCRWRVSVLEKMPRHSRFPETILQMLLPLNGIYESYEQIRSKIKDVPTRGIKAENGLIYHTGPGSLSIQTPLGSIDRVF